jgi:hypothetical protein
MGLLRCTTTETLSELKNESTEVGKKQIGMIIQHALEEIM